MRPPPGEYLRYFRRGLTGRILASGVMTEQTVPSPVPTPREDRIAVNHIVEFTRASAPKEFLEATVLDLSRTGLQFATDDRFLHGEAVTVYWGRHCLAGSVIYCRKLEGGFRVGVRLAPDARWQQQLFPK